MTRCFCLFFTLFLLASSASAQNVDLSRFHFVHVIVTGEQVQFDLAQNTGGTVFAPIRIDNTFDSLIWDSTLFNDTVSSSYEEPPIKGSPPYWITGSDLSTVSGSVDLVQKHGYGYVHLDHHYLESIEPYNTFSEVSGDDHIQDCTLTALDVLLFDTSHLVLASNSHNSLSYSATDLNAFQHELMHNYTARDTTIPTIPVSIRLYFSTTRAADTIRILADVNKPAKTKSEFVFTPTIADRWTSINAEGGELHIFNTLGEHVFSMRIQNQGNTSINTVFWPNGLYFATLSNGAFNASAKFVVKH
jgi:hypothetical protein